MTVVSATLHAAAQGFSLSLVVSHSVVLSGGSDPVSFRVPENIDILSSSDITFTLSGSFNRVQVASEMLLRSALVRRLQCHLMTHSEELCLNNVSCSYIDNDGILKFTVSSARPLLHSDQSPAPTATLMSIGLTFSCISSIDDDHDSFTHPFSSQLLLPVQSTLDILLKRFCSRDLVRRYPLIFGTWRNFLDVEINMLPHIVHSILDILHRSKDDYFRRKCFRLLKKLRKQHLFAFSTALNELENQFEACKTETIVPQDVGNETILTVSLQRLHRSFVRPPRFKGSTILDSSDDAEFDFCLTPSRQLNETFLDVCTKHKDPVCLALDLDNLFYETSCLIPTQQNSKSDARSDHALASLDVCEFFELDALNSRSSLDCSSEIEESNICLYSDDEVYQCTDYAVERITSTNSQIDGLDFSEAFGATSTSSPVGLEDEDLLDFGDG